MHKFKRDFIGFWKSPHLDQALHLARSSWLGGLVGILGSVWIFLNLTLWWAKRWLVRITQGTSLSSRNSMFECVKIPAHHSLVIFSLLVGPCLPVVLGCAILSGQLLRGAGGLIAKKGLFCIERIAWENHCKFRMKGLHKHKE